MDQRETLNLSAPASYYLHRGNAEAVVGLQDSSILNPLTNAAMHFAPNSGNSSIGSALLLDTASTMSTHGASAGPPSAMLQVEPMRRKRGRPRKYGRDASVSSRLLPSTSNPMSTLYPNQKRRGRPPGIAQKPPISFLGGSLINVGSTFVPHIIHVEKGEDIRRKILSSFAQGQGAVVILSGTGSISTVDCRISSSGGIITYEGRFDMLNLSGSYLLHDKDGPCGTNGGLNVILAGPDGRIIGGSVEGVLIAGSLVQIIVGIMSPHTSKTKSKSGESLKSSGDLHLQNVGISAAPANIQPTPNLTPMDAWPILL